MDCLEARFDGELRQLQEQEQALVVRFRNLEAGYAGLRDLDLWLGLISVRLSIAIKLLERLRQGVGSSSATGDGDYIREKALAAVTALEELRSLDISEDQKSVLTDAPAYTEIPGLLERFVALGGGALLDQREQDERTRRTVVRALVESLHKFLAPEDRYKQVFKTERLPPFFRRLVGFFWPILARENQQEPPYGIEEAQEVLLSSERMKMPLSQAVYYLETELLPYLEKELEKDPGDPLLQRRRRMLRDRLREYKNIRFLPRATPLNLERGFYTDWLSHFTADGELLVTVELPVQLRSGTNLDRLKEYVQNEIVRRLAGKGICPELDADYRFRRSLDSGRRGNSRVPSMKVDFRRGFRMLRDAFPVLRRLEDRRQLQTLLDTLRNQGARRTQKLLEQQARKRYAGGLLPRDLIPPTD